MVHRATARVAPIHSSKLAHYADFTLSAEDSNVINVDIQLRDARGRNVAERAGVEFYLSDDAEGDGLTATAATAMAVRSPATTYGDDVPLVTNKAALGVTTAAGYLGLGIFYAGGAKTWYLVIVLHNGELAVSQAITFA